LQLVPILTGFDMLAFFCRAFSWALLGPIPVPGSFAASAFPVPPLTRWAPPIKQPLALEPEAFAFGAPGNEAEKGEKFMSYLYVKWNSFGLRFARRRFGH
jgi:hypothetical protein